jgi:pimeloyl-ACP methyl ester carboxylesterase
MHQLTLTREPRPRPLADWPSVAVELLGTQTRIVRGERWHHRVIEAGEGGEPLILIHGIGGHAETYARNMHNLARAGFHVYAIDALFHGYSSKEPYRDEARAALQAEGVLDLVDALGHERVHIEGESMGATIAFEYGMAYPERTRGIVFNTGFADVHFTRTDFATNAGGGAIAELSLRSILEPSFETMRARMEWLVAAPGRMTAEMVAIRQRLYEDPDVLASMKRMYRVGKSFHTLPRWTEEEVATFPARSLVFWTEKNPGDGPEFGRYIAGLLPDAGFYCMADAAHWPQWEKPEEHDQVLIDFLLGPSAAGHGEEGTT